MELTLEVVNLQVSDLDRAKRFYTEGCGFRADLDQEVAPGVRIIQLTPPGSRCSVALAAGLPAVPGLTKPAPGTAYGLQLCSTDITATREALAAGGVDVSAVMHLGEGGWAEGKGGVWNSFLFFADPDGNSWTVQEAPAPLSER
ncbi:MULTISPECIES: VOC family protein [Streptomyces]|uniref:Glyoxalase n=1 Tax=Streptomyces tsukubensis (strain DSM 42081 / NBRC 108919 / NRRL 18488 / 9993) TaxID=1114943 RepID=I2MXA3_STRT9|nr:MULTISPECIES: VOC family protein [Streptomyces]AZK93787.1 glyoxalase [Streptomyces tsukubensis]EIF89400.1 Glyoxalase/bleomycin resistance protein/dioxygenase [Streptomyces tsukubensis NRRL18488]MYS67332.1 VOC family protein [Streptomyces sp. SID5473]QKM70076.1 glyoxalase [Streptomyces tsukubensis NRRL18488]TAI45948.1 VOC family protein [Streptomyces tsukubensis]